MSNKVYKRVNKYNIGSWLEKNAGGVASALGGAATMVSDVQGALAGNQEAINNTKAGINEVNSTTFNAGNTNSLMSQWGAANYMDPVTSKQLRSDKGALGVLSGAATGLSAGAALGPVGAIGGAIAGIGSGIASWIGGKSKAKKRARKLNEQIAQANNRLDRNFETAVDNLEEQQLNNALMNYAAYGGPLESNGVTWPSDLMFINNGDTHENNPNEGVQIGVDSQGVPNLVEEGEVVYGDYVFSNRLKVPKKDRKEFKLGNKDISFADAVEKFAEESKERPNDPISKLGLETNLNKLIASQEGVRNMKGLSQNNKFEQGGNKNTYSPYKKFYPDRNRTKWYNIDKNNPSKISSYTDEYRNIDFTVDDAVAWAKANADDASLKDYYAKGNTLEGLTQDYVTNKSLDNTYGWMHEARAAKTSEIHPDEPEVNLGNIDDIIIDDSISPIDDDVKLDSDVSLGVTKRKIPKKRNWQSLLRYAPVLGNAIGLLDNKANYTNANAAARAINNAQANVSPTYLGNYLSYNPFDIDYQANKINAQAAANRRAINNTNYGNRSMANAALLAADLNAQTAIGDAYRGAAEYNQGLRERVEAFNKGTNQYNSQAGLQADMFNAESKRALLGAKMQELAMRDSERNRYEDAKSANITSLFDNLGAIGKEQTMIDMFNNNPYLLYEALTGKYKAACGGKIKRRRK